MKNKTLTSELLDTIQMCRENGLPEAATWITYHMDALLEGNARVVTSPASIDTVKKGFEEWYDEPSYNPEERDWYVRYPDTVKGKAAASWLACYRWLTGTKHERY